MHSVDSTICKADWWKAKFNKDEPSALDKSAIDNFSNFSKFAFLVFYFSHVENNLRKTINLVSPGFDVTKSKAFKHIYDEFFIRLGLTKYIPLFDIARNIRNSVHSNGIFIARNGANINYTWKGQTYHFVHLHPIDFVTWDFTIYLFQEILEAVKDILNTTFFTNAHFIEDTFN